MLPGLCLFRGVAPWGLGCRLGWGAHNPHRPVLVRLRRGGAEEVACMPAWARSRVAPWRAARRGRGHPALSVPKAVRVLRACAAVGCGFIWRSGVARAVEAEAYAHAAPGSAACQRGTQHLGLTPPKGPRARPLRKPVRGARVGRWGVLPFPTATGASRHLILVLLGCGRVGEAGWLPYDERVGRAERVCTATPCTCAARASLRSGRTYPPFLPSCQVLGGWASSSMGRSHGSISPHCVQRLADLAVHGPQG